MKNLLSFNPLKNSFLSLKKEKIRRNKPAERKRKKFWVVGVIWLLRYFTTIRGKAHKMNYTRAKARGITMEKKC
jgi:hypothetical protein